MIIFFLAIIIILYSKFNNFKSYYCIRLGLLILNEKTGKK